jgi:hypothetical protein
LSEEDLEWETGKFSVKGVPEKFNTIPKNVFASYTNHIPITPAKVWNILREKGVIQGVDMTGF